MMRILLLLYVLMASYGRQAGVPEAAEKFVRGVQWQRDSVIEGDFTCGGRGQHAILGISADHIVVAVFIDGTTQPPQVLRYSTKARDVRTATLALEDLDWDPKAEGLELPGFRRSRTCKGLSPTTPQVQMASGAPMVLLVLALLLVGCTGSQIQPSQETNSYFEELATAAKARGESEVKISNRSGPLHAQSLENVLADASVVVATAEPNSTTGAADRRIMTWQQFSVDQWLVRQAPDDSPMCNVTKPPQSPPEGKIVIGLAKGSVNIGGVSITDVSDGDLNFNEKQRYLMFGLQCPNGRFIIPWGTTGIYQVSPEGSILTTSLNEGSAFSREVRRFATIASLAEEVRKMKQLKRER